MHAKSFLQSAFVCALLALPPVGCSSPHPEGSLPAAADPVVGPIVMQDAQLGPGDEIRVEVYRDLDLSRTMIIPNSGVIFYPLVGEVKTEGISANELRRRLAEGLGRYLVNPQVSVTMTAIRSQKVIVLGEVIRPGVLTLYGPMSALEAVSQAGGFTVGADQKKILRLRRQGQDVRAEVIDVELALASGKPQGNPGLQGGDVVYVPPTLISDWARFARNVEQLLRPVLLTQQSVLLGYDIKDAINGDRRAGSTTIVIPSN